MSGAALAQANPLRVQGRLHLQRLPEVISEGNGHVQLQSL
jgi:hypothetical protein